MQRLRLPHQIGHEVDDRTKHVGDVGHPAAHGGARQVDAVPAEDAFQAMQRQMVGVLAGDDLGQQAGAGQALVDDRDRHRRDGDMVMTLRAGVLEADVLPDEQAGRLVIELLADVLAELLADFAATGTEPLRLGQACARLAARGRSLGSGLRPWPLRFLASPAASPACACSSAGGLSGAGVSAAVGHLGNEPRLVRIETFRLLAVQTAQQLIEAMTQAFTLVLRLLEGVEQFDDHGLQRRQDRRATAAGWSEVEGRAEVEASNVRVHVYETSTDAESFTTKSEKEKILRRQ